MKKFYVRFDVNTVECPCGSRTVTKDCCLRPNGKLIPARVKTPLDFNNSRPNPKCYAAEIGGCHGKVNREHYFSESVLRLLNTQNGMQILGAAGCEPGTMRAGSVSSEAARILCEAHNSALSPLDAVARRFFKAIDDATSDLTSTDRILVANKLCLINGHDLERWALKALCGFVFSGNAVNSKGEIVRGWKPPRDWLTIIYGLGGMPQQFGLYASGVPHSPSPDCAGIKPFGTDSEIFGAIFRFRTVEFSLIMAHPQYCLSIPSIAGSSYRPGGFNFTMHGMTRKVFIEWEDDLARVPFSLGVANLPAPPLDDKEAWSQIMK